MKHVLVVAAHPDDEALGCGGTIARHAADGDTIKVLFMTDGEGARGERTHEAERRADACRTACALLGASDLTHFDFPDNAMDSVPQLKVAQAIEGALKNFRPDIVYTHHAQDLNVDHRMTHEATMTALRPLPGLQPITILAFEVASSTEWRSPSAATIFVPDWYEDISATLAAKLDALKAYHSEMREWPHARSIEALEHLARWRGATVGVAAAEAFKLVRRVG